MSDATFVNKPSFGSDNHSGVHPEILKAIVAANTSHAPSYGTDDLSQKLEQKVMLLFGDSYRPYLVFNGTAANVLGLTAITKPWQSTLCSQISHLNLDECGAPEVVGQRKLIPVACNSLGKINPEELKKHLIRFGDQHFSQPGALSITQPTEVGTVYTLDELRTLAQVAKEFQLKLHIDGARFSNAAHTLKTTFQEMLKAFPADAVSFGGTKNGLMGCEMVLIKNVDKADDSFKYLRKQMMQLPSKTRFLAAQMIAYLEGDLYRKVASHSCQMAQKLAESLQHRAPFKIRYPVESNAVFVEFPKTWTKPLRETLFFYIWETEPWTARLMTSFDTTLDDVHQWVAKAAELEKTPLDRKDSYEP